MKTKRAVHPPLRVMQPQFHHLGKKGASPPVRAKQSEDQKRGSGWSEPHHQDAFQALSKSIIGLRAWTPHRVENGCAIRVRASIAFLSTPWIKIETELMYASVVNADAGPCIPCHMSIVSDMQSNHILDSRLFYGATLHEATFKGLDSMLEKVPGPVSMYARMSQRYRYRGTDYEVAAFRGGSVWLRTATSPDWKAILHRSRKVPHRWFQTLPTTQTFPLPRHRMAVRADVLPPFQIRPRHQRLDRQPEAINDLLRHRVWADYWKPGFNYRGLRSLIAMDIECLKQLRPLGDPLRRPCWATLYHLMRFPRRERR